MSQAEDRQLLRRALDLHRAGSLAQAELLYRAVLEPQPRPVYALRMLGVLRRQNGDLEGSIGFLGRAVQARPGDLPATVELAVSQIQAGRSGDAETALARALQRQPGVPEAWLVMAEAQAAQEKLDAAL